MSLVEVDLNRQAAGYPATRARVSRPQVVLTCPVCLLFQLQRLCGALSFAFILEGPVSARSLRISDAESNRLPQSALQRSAAFLVSGSSLWPARQGKIRESSRVPSGRRSRNKQKYKTVQVQAQFFVPFLANIESKHNTHKLPFSANTSSAKNHLDATISTHCTPLINIDQLTFDATTSSPSTSKL